MKICAVSALLVLALSSSGHAEKQETKGNCSPIIQYVQHDVKINCTQYEKELERIVALLKGIGMQERLESKQLERLTEIFEPLLKSVIGSNSDILSKLNQISLELSVERNQSGHDPTKFLQRVGTLIPILDQTVHRDVQFKIVKPRDEDRVGEGERVEFWSPHAKLRHYILVIPLSSPNRWLVDGPIDVPSPDAVDGRARFGSRSLGKGEKFLVRILATTELLREGILSALPDDSKLSKSVLVERTQ